MIPTSNQATTHPSLPEIFGDNVRAFREAEALDLDAFAAMLGVERSTAESIEQGGQDDLSLHHVEVIGAKLGIEPLLLLQ
jgi:transcriptional regulator with XRE-family HTH domain